MRLFQYQNVHSDRTVDARVALITYLRTEHGVNSQDNELHRLLDVLTHAAHKEVAAYASTELESLTRRLSV